MRLSQLLLLLALCTGGIGIWVLRYRARRADDHLHIPTGLFIGAIGPTIIAIVLLLGGSLKWLIAVHAVYLFLGLSLPMVCAGALIIGRDRLAAGAKWALAAGMAPALLAGYATHVEATWLRFDTIVVEADVHTTVRVGVIADIQNARVGAYEREVIDRMIAADPDFVLLAGDLWQVPNAELTDELRQPFDELIRELVDAIGVGKVFIVEGDHDRHADLSELGATTGATVLVDEVATIEVRDQAFAILGLAVGSQGPWRRLAIEELAAAQAREPDAYSIVLAHHPDVFLSFEADERADLFVGGHTHGGQVILPLIGPLLTFTEVPRHVARGGLHMVDGHQVYVSSGAGVERDEAPQVRFLSRPSIAILEISPAAEESTAHVRDDRQPTS